MAAVGRLTRILTHIPEGNLIFYNFSYYNFLAKMNGLDGIANLSQNP